MKLRITSNGMGQGSKVQNIETGEYLPGVRHVDISIPVDGPVIAKIEIAGVEVDVVTLINNQCGTRLDRASTETSALE